MHDLQRDFVRYMAFVGRLCGNCDSVVVAENGSSLLKHIAENGVSPDEACCAGFAPGGKKKWASLRSTCTLRRVWVDISLSFRGGSASMARQYCGSVICFTSVSARDPSALSFLATGGALFANC